MENSDTGNNPSLKKVEEIENNNEQTEKVEEIENQTDNEITQDNKKESSQSKQTKKGKDKKSFFSEYLKWPLMVLAIVLAISFSFSVLSQLALDGATVAIAIAVIFVFLVLSVLTDIVGVAITAVNITPFRSMSAKKVKGAKEAVVLIKNADKVASIFADILGDVCGILSGSAGAVITAIYVQNSTNVMQTVIIASVVSAVTAGLIISTKAFFKKWALANCNGVILLLGKVVRIFTFGKLGKKKKK